MDADGGAVKQEVVVRTAVEFPYIPGYLAYREFPAIEACFRRLDPPPDLLMIDGQGVLHPARFGIACMAGVTLGVPAIGVAKSLLVGNVGRLAARVCPGVPDIASGHLILSRGPIPAEL